MAGGVHVEHEALQSQAQQLDQSYTELVTVLNRLKGQIGDLVSTGFVTDSASGSFAEAHERWNGAANTCIVELNTMRDYLKQTSDAFAQTDSSATIRL